LLWVETAAWTVGLVALGGWTAITGGGRLAAHRALQQFEAEAAAGAPDRRLWSPERVRAWQETRSREGPTPLAVLRIPRIAVEVPVLEGIDEWTLNRAAGHIPDTARPGAAGNVGIAAHRDGFFRGLKDVRAGDLLLLETLAAVDVYRVQQSWVVDPDDVSVLQPTASRSVTLVTCYPFYFVGSAPQRFIVRAVWTHSAQRRAVAD
jgi:sortase A